MRVINVMHKLLFLIILFSITGAQSVTASSCYVEGYFTASGTYVQGYYRSCPNNTVTDNYSYYGNTNPYTGSTGTNRYYQDDSSEYYGGGSSGYGFFD